MFAGNIICQNVDAIVNVTNVELKHCTNSSKYIQDAGGPQLIAECRTYLARHGKLKVSEPMHTSAGNIPVRYVIHVAGPRLIDCTDDDEFHLIVSNTVENVLRYANDVLSATSVAIPPVISGRMYSYSFDCCSFIYSVKYFSRKYASAYNPEFQEGSRSTGK